MESTLKKILETVYQFLKDDFQYPEAPGMKCKVSFRPDPDVFGSTILLIKFAENFKFYSVVERLYRLTGMFNMVSFSWEPKGVMTGKGDYPSIELTCRVEENPPRMETRSGIKIETGIIYNLSRLVGNEE
jgi:hypothetical protein